MTYTDETLICLIEQIKTLNKFDSNNQTLPKNSSIITSLVNMPT
jgi:hypothetical protein